MGGYGGIWFCILCKVLLYSNIDLSIEIFGIFYCEN